jgi:RimJ/RimL family protein N-acetyltransferase
VIPDDLDAVADLYADPVVMRWIGTGGPRTREHAAEAVARTMQGYEERGYGDWATILRSTGRVVGLCGLLYWPDLGGVEEVEVAYLLARDVWRQGLATEAATAIRDWGFRELGRTRLVSVIYHDNVGSIAVARKIGMSWEKDVGFKDVTVALYSLSRSDDRP